MNRVNDRRPEPGAVIGGFRLEERLHRGGMATLWRVTRDDLAGPLIMKIPTLGGFENSTAIVGFEVEQMVLPTLAGPHVPRFYASGDFDTQPFIVMERIGGDSLRARMDDAPLEPAEVAERGARLAQAVHALHLQGVIHHDIKPSNVMFRPGGEAVLIDYGLARHDGLPDLLAEEFRVPMGTGPYISPEQVLHIRNDPRSDLFAIGVLLYLLATGERPFGAPSGASGLRKRLYRDPRPPRDVRPEVPPWLQEVILRCLEVDPSLRYQSAAQLAFDLQHPEQVTLTGRAGRLRRDGRWAVFKRWFRAIGREPTARQSAQAQSRTAPIVVAAVDLSAGMEALAEALGIAARRVFDAEPGARLACLTVLKTHRIANDLTTDAQGNNLHVKHLVQLKHWARSLSIAPERISCHVIEAPDPAAAIVDYASVNRVDHIVIGSRGSSTLRRYLGSVSAQVVAQAPCTVTVVRSPGQQGVDEGAPAERRAA